MEQLPAEKRLNQRVKTRNGNTRGHPSLEKRQLEDGALEVHHIMKSSKKVNVIPTSHSRRSKRCSNNLIITKRLKV